VRIPSRCSLLQLTLCCILLVYSAGLLCVSLPLGLIVGYASILFMLMIDGVMWLGYTHHSQYPNGHDSLAESGVDDVSKVIFSSSSS